MEDGKTFPSHKYSPLGDVVKFFIKVGLNERTREIAHRLRNILTLFEIRGNSLKDYPKKKEIEVIRMLEKASSLVITGRRNITPPLDVKPSTFAL